MPEQITQAQAPSVFWDVGMDLLNYPTHGPTEGITGEGVENTMRFWQDVANEGFACPEGLHVNDPPGNQNMGVGEPNAATDDNGGGSSTGSTHAPLVPTYIGEQVRTNEMVEEPSAIQLGESACILPTNTEKRAGKALEKTPTEFAEGSKATIHGGREKKGGQRAEQTSSEGSSTEGELGEYGNNVTEGMMFRNREAFKQHMAIYAISMKFQYRSRKSEPGLMVLECCGLNCPWRVYAVKLKDADVFEVRKVVSEHTCSIDERGGYQTQATSSVIGELMRNKFGSAGGGPKPREIRQMMRGDHDVNISYWKAWRSRDVAIDKAKGTTQSSYHLLPDYLQRLVTANPGTITKLYTETVEGGGERFKYMFVAFGASIKGYEFMRKVVVVDGTHLKGKYAGCLLTASAQDGNYQIFPLAFAVVDSENDSSWEWFFEQLSAFVERDDELVFVSDRHMSIYKGLSKVYPGVGHCICVVHLKRNIRSNFRARHLEYLVAKAARTFRLQEFYTTFNEIKTMDPACAEYLLDIGLEHWARSHFPGKRYNIMTSNLAESWNSVLREAREFPVIPLIDFIRTKLTGWFATRREAAQKNMGSMSPKVSGMLTKSFEQTGGYGVTQIGEDEYEVRNKNGGSFHVDLDKKTCSCYEFQVLAIPCSHAIAAAIKAKISVESLVLPAYTIEGLRSAYAGSVLPVPDYTGVSDLVSDFGGMKLCPPVTRRPPGRPKKQR
ncbi:uncharacterized protein LOC117133063 [Brassica rapa]|nr:uncharacterized protein LOC108870744 [Brassica rapa]XP_033139808.1 uncharacterized protein LOC117131692 [Brassica rapa]XP_033144990.1 uncharacterized protein LOC117133063 [Brassica rapa]